jgi:iron complex outermembrane recepter protein
MSSTSWKSSRARLLCSSGLVLASAMLVATAAAAQETQTIETVVITGSRLAVTTAFDAPTPVSVVGAEDIKMTGTVNMEGLLAQSPQFTAATNGGVTANTVQANGDSGAASLNLRGLGAQRNLVLVNGRRFAIQSTSLITDINTIPTALIQRTEIVTGGSSAVYGSDAISGVVNFIMKQDFEGVEGNAQYSFDQFTTSPTYNFDLTMGGNFDHDKGNIVVALNYSSRKGFTQPDHGGWTNVQYTDACVTAASYSPTNAGTRLSGASTGASCVAAGGKNGFVAGGSGDTPNGYIKGLTTYASANSTLQGLYTAAGLSGMTSDGMIFGSAATPTTVRDRDSSSDLYNLIATNYMQVPLQRWMMNSFAHYDFNKHFKGYAEFHFSSNTVSAQLTPANANGSMIIDTHDPAFSSALQSVFDYLDSQETGTTTITAGTGTFTTTPGDGKVAVTFGKRFIENGKRRQDANRVTWRFAGGFKGDIGSVDNNFLKDLSYDVYYTYARTQETDNQSGSISRSKLQQYVLATTNGGTPTCELFGTGALSQACIDLITVQSEVVTTAEMQGAQASIAGTAFDLPAGPVQFALGGEWRYTMAQYLPDMSTRTGDIAGLNSSAATKGSIVVHEGFGEVRVPVLSDLPLIDKLTINAAFRESGYNLRKAGGVLTWSSGADWKVMDQLTIRGQYQRSIRAPNVAELFGGLASNTASGVVDPCGSLTTTAQRTTAVQAICLAQGVSSSNLWTSAIQGTGDLVRYTSGGNDQLAPEKSDTITLGAVVMPDYIPGLAVSLDFYSINIHGQIASIGGSAAGVLSNCFYPSTGSASASSPYCTNVMRSSSGTLLGSGYVATANANIGGTAVRGLDLNGQYSFEAGFGLLTDSAKVDLNEAWSYLLTYDGTPSLTDPSTKNRCAGTYGNTYCAWEPMPYLKGTQTIRWHDGPLSLSLRWRYIGGVQLDKFRKAVSGTAAANYTKPYLPDMNYFDISANYDINENLTVYGGINNLLSKDPPIIGSNQSYANSLPATYDSFGRVTFIGITAKTN